MSFFTVICPLKVMKAAMMRDDNPDLAYAVDIWSLGCTIIEMLTGKPPWSEYEGVSTLLFLVTHHNKGRCSLFL